MYQDFIKKILLKASEIANSSFGKVSSGTKPGDINQVLTQTDLEIGKFIIGECQKNFTEYNIIDEEAGVIDKKSEFTWVIDPIDGTSNFANGLSTYGIMFGLLKDGESIAGGIALPYFGEIYSAEKGQGAYCNEKPILVSPETDLLNSLVAYQIDAHQENPELTRDETKLLAEIILNIRNLRDTSSAYDLAMVSCGKYGAILNKTSKIWDNVAQQILIEEAGGTYTDFYGNTMDYSNPLSRAKQNFEYVAGAPLLHKKLIDIIKLHS